jgi:hypothetical protein
VTTPIDGSTVQERSVLKISEHASPDARRFLYGGFSALAISTLVLAWLRAPAALVPVLLMLLVASVFVTLLSTALTDRASAAARTFLWAVMLFIFSLMGLFVSAAFFGVPQIGAVAIARIFDAPELLSTGSHGAEIRIRTDEVKPATAEFLRPLDVIGKDDRFSREQSLHQRPSLRVDGTLVAASAPGTTTHIYADVIDLEKGTIVTNGADVTIEANKIISGGGAVRSFLGEPAPSETGKGRDVGHVYLVIYDRIVGKLQVNLPGGRGAMGVRGADGIVGRDGAEGDGAADHLFDCAHGGGRGGDGQSGTNGERGWPGFAGGDGGLLTVLGSRPESLQESIEFIPAAGQGGPGGQGGLPGAGGRAGSGGSGSHWCHGGESGTAGTPGVRGQQGPDGPAGLPSHMTLKPLV